MTDLQVIEGGATPTKPTRRQRRSKRKRDGIPLGTLDAIDNLILSAQGIELAVMGEGTLSNFDSSPISRLLDMHIAEIQAITDSLQNGEGDS